MAFRWRADVGPPIVVFGIFPPYQTKKKEKEKINVIKVGPPLTKLSGSALDMFARSHVFSTVTAGILIRVQNAHHLILHICFSTITNAVSTPKNRLIDTALLRTKITCLFDEQENNYN